MELSMREKELLVMFGSERRLDTHKRLQNAIPGMQHEIFENLWHVYKYFSCKDEK